MGWLKNIVRKIKNFFKDEVEDFLKAEKVKVSLVGNVLIISIDEMKFTFTLSNDKAKEIMDDVRTIAGIVSSVTLDKNDVVVTGPTVLDVIRYLVRKGLLKNKV